MFAIETVSGMPYSVVLTFPSTPVDIGGSAYKSFLSFSVQCTVYFKCSFHSAIHVKFAFGLSFRIIKSFRPTFVFFIS